jgi:serine/threonine protein kinase/WD40 repeat protein
LDEFDPSRLGAYTLLGRLGAGGMGTVYLGRRDDGGQLVAVKVIRSDWANDPEYRSRFAREARAAQRVHHAYTAEVLDVVTGTRPYIVTTYIEGPTLAEQVRDHGPLPADQLEWLAREVADALRAIHAAGVIHRDLKPHNILLSRFGARVIDFGIARALDSTTTTTHGLVGTPAYMAPEQVISRNVTEAADIHAWGAILVFAATGQLPFAGDTVHMMMRRIAEDTPDLAALPESLRPLVAQALAKDPADRPTAAQLADLIRSPRPVPPRSLAIAMGPATGTLLGSDEVTTPAVIPATPFVGEDSRDIPDGLSPTLARLTPELDAAAHGGTTDAVPGTTPPVTTDGDAPAGIRVTLAKTAVEDATAVAPEQSVPDQRDPGSVEAGSVEAGSVEAVAPQAARRPRRRRWVAAVAAGATAIIIAVVTPVVLSEGGAGSAGRTTNTVSQTRDLRATATLRRSAVGPVHAVAFSANGTAVAVGTDNGTVWLWDVANIANPTTLVGGPLTGPLNSVTGVGFSSDSGTLAAGSLDGAVYLWDVTTKPATPQTLGHLSTGQSDAVHTITFSHDGRTLAAGADDGIWAWDISDPARPKRLGLPPDTRGFAVISLALSPDGRTVAVAASDGTVRLWRLAADGSATTLGQAAVAGVSSVAFSADSHTLAAGTTGGTIHLVDVTGAAGPTLLGPALTDPGGAVNAVAFSPVGHTLAAGGADGTVRLWDLTVPASPKPLGERLTGPTSYVTSVAFSSDGTIVAAGSEDQTVRLWKLG